MMIKLFLALCLFPFSTAIQAQGPAPDSQIKQMTTEVLEIIKQEKDAHPDKQKKMNELVEAKVRPHFDFSRMTAIAAGGNWAKASAEQQKALTNEFRTLLVRSYSSAMSAYRNQAFEFKPVRTVTGDTQVTVRTQVKQAGSEPINIDYSMEKTPRGWAVYEIAVGGVSLVTNYRETFNTQIRNGGVDGLIKSLAGKNKAQDTPAAAK